MEVKRASLGFKKGGADIFLDQITQHNLSSYGTRLGLTNQAIA